MDETIGTTGAGTTYRRYSRLGLYGLKPWFADRLSSVRRVLVARGVRPGTISAFGVLFGAGAGLVLAFTPPGPVRGITVAVLLIARLGCANLDGAVAREAGSGTRFGVVVNELGDRMAELAVLAGCLTSAPVWLVATAALAASAPSWVSLAGVSAGATRIQGGPVGKTERCLLLVVLASGGGDGPLLMLLAIGSALTAALRLRRLRTVLAVAEVSGS